jgi:hypothetical protein
VPGAGDDDGLAEQLRELKRRSGRSYEALARRLGVSSSALHRYVSGEGTPSRFTVLERFAVECGASRAELTELQRRWTRHVMRSEADAAGDRGADLAVLPDGPAAAGAAPVTEATAGGAPGGPAPAAPSPPAAQPADDRPAVAPADRRLRRALAPTAVVAAAAVLYAAFAWGADRDGTSVVLPSAPAPEACVERAGASHVDTFLTHREWTTDYVCPNDVRTPLYLTPSSGRKIGVMDTPRSWFLCWMRGRVQGDSGRIWYYTRGDRSEPGTQRYGGWGFMPSEYVHATRHPWPGMPACDVAAAALAEREASAGTGAG